jgi:hypothetical protein
MQDTRAGIRTLPVRGRVLVWVGWKLCLVGALPCPVAAYLHLAYPQPPLPARSYAALQEYEPSSESESSVPGHNVSKIKFAHQVGHTDLGSHLSGGIVGQCPVIRVAHG